MEIPELPRFIHFAGQEWLVRGVEKNKIIATRHDKMGNMKIWIPIEEFDQFPDCRTTIHINENE